VRVRDEGDQGVAAKFEHLQEPPPDLFPLPHPSSRQIPDVGVLPQAEQSAAALTDKNGERTDEKIAHIVMAPSRSKHQLKADHRRLKLITEGL
jgi:hypothetical protein